MVVAVRSSKGINLCASKHENCRDAERLVDSQFDGSGLHLRPTTSRMCLIVGMVLRAHRPGRLNGPCVLEACIQAGELVPVA
jgi:hypothetical protein